MPTVALFVQDTAGNAAARSKASIDVVSGWSATIINDDAISSTDISGYDVVAICRTGNTEAAAIAAELMTMDKPLFVGAVEASNPEGVGYMSVAAHMGIMDTVEVVGSTHSTISASPGHPVTDEANLNGVFAVSTAAQWYNYAEGSYVGTVLATNDYVTPAGGYAVGSKPAILAVEAGQLTGYSKRILWSNGLYGQLATYTADGQALMESSLNWLVSTAGPEAPATGGLNSLQSHVRSCKTQPVVFAFLGSSTTAGVGPSDPNNAYVERTARRLQRALTEPLVPAFSPSAASSSPLVSPGVHIVGAGISGARSNDYAPSTLRTQLQQAGTTVYVHAIGANDHNANVAPSTVKANVKAVIDAIDTGTPSALHVIFHQQQRPDATSTTYAWSEYRDVLSALVTESPSRRIFVDASDEFVALGVPGADPNNLVAADGIHINDEGHDILTNILLADLMLDFPVRIVVDGVEMAVDVVGYGQDGVLVTGYLEGAKTFTPVEGETPVDPPVDPGGTPTTLIRYDFTTLAPSFTEPGVSGGSATRHDGVTPATTSTPGYSTDPIGRMDRTSSGTMRVRITPDAGKTLHISSFTFLAAKGGSGTRGIAWEHSIDGGNTWVEFYRISDIPTTRPNWTLARTNMDLTIAGPVDFRAFAFTSNNSQTVEIDNLEIEGYVV